jgi:hypothetical protein
VPVGLYHPRNAKVSNLDLQAHMRGNT